MLQPKKKRIEMHTPREVVRLILTTDLSNREIATRCHVSHVSVGTYRKQIAQIGMTWKGVEKITESELEKVLKIKRARFTFYYFVASELCRLSRVPRHEFRFSIKCSRFRE